VASFDGSLAASMLNLTPGLKETRSSFLTLNKNNASMLHLNKVGK
jgi:hypothetical protein